MIAAAQAQEHLGVQRDGYIDVFAALRAADIEVMGRPMGGLLGLYVAPGDGGPACMLNCGLEEVSMRHTLAHELGHHRLGHGTSIDHDAHSTGRWGEGWPQHEKEAEAFASWFLMPLPAVLTALARCGITRPTCPADVYRMARWLGTPYATTVRHLVRLKMIDKATERLWLKHSPGVLKTELAAGLAVAPGCHVHLLGPGAHSGTLHTAAGDCLLLEVPTADWDGAPTGTSTQAPADQEQLSLLGGAIPAPQVLWVTTELTSPLTLTASTTTGEIFLLTVHRTPQRQGSDRFWA